ncbi:related to C6 finger domain protein [Rhynchosporium graminicola]|uniref:Related to C6 finger domain protein n=1 Tax=Rhynchosporium graminicola TaxID=2792576 RepID=A0A1E1KS28_9HELO|nr:related to C6 finger domain protein [Rhynchosporium commune]
MTHYSHDYPAERVSSQQQQVASFTNPLQRGFTSSTHLSSASSYADLQYLFGVQDTMMNPPKPHRNRRKSNPNPDQTKHRRTRSGCYTCRSRRVKCDETRPLCERCKKGGRECVYPETSTSAKALRSTSSSTLNLSSHESPGSSSDESEEDLSQERLEAIPDEVEASEDSALNNDLSKYGMHQSSSTQFGVGQKSTVRHDSETPSLIQDKGASPTPSTEGSVGYGQYDTIAVLKTKKTRVPFSTNSDTLRSDWSHLPLDLQFYLTYFYENVTHLHYSLKFDAANFLQTTFLDAALRNEPLLYAVVGFSAFQRTLHTTEGRIQDFLQYYNKAVSLLLTSLKRGERHTNGTLLAILQLATVEEFLGDWMNLLGHQKAAFEILTELYTPETVMEDPLTRVILGWYMRFDVFAGLMGGFETVLSREWFSVSQEFFQDQVAKEPDVLDWKIESAIAQHRLVATDMSLLFVKRGKKELSDQQFMTENNAIARRIEEWKTMMDPALQDPRYLINDFPGARPLDPEDIVDPYMPGIIYHGPLWAMNVAMIDWYAIDMMHKYQTALTMQTQPSADLGAKAYATCQLFEAVEFWPGSPPGTVLACQASLGIACLFLPRDETHSMWARRKLATIESKGYIYPYTFRTKMADLFQDRSCMHWWLPNDENYPQIVRSIRKFVEERTSPAKTEPAEDLRDMKAIFASLKLDDGKPTLPSTEEGMNAAIHSGLAGRQEMYAEHKNLKGVDRHAGQEDSYQLGLDDGHEYWDRG